ncbi:MAG TPA: hypothetical protein VF701_18070 [Thermoanaerobaculia bacterium]
MEQARITFTKLIQDSQDLGSDDDHMISRVFFDLEYRGKTYSGLHVDLKQSVGGNIESDPLEVGKVGGYSGPGNYVAFRDAVEQYFRSLVGSGGHGIRITGGTNIRMRNNTFNQRMVVEFPVTAQGGW